MDFTDTDFARAARAAIRAGNDGKDLASAIKEALVGPTMTLQYVSVDAKVFDLSKTEEVVKLQEAITSLARRCHDAEAKLTDQNGGGL